MTELEIKTAEPFLSVVMPAYNEEATITAIVRQVLALPFLLELIIVDDRSTDNTFSLIETLAAGDDRIRVVKHDVNSGKSAALRTGFALTTGDIVVVQDADLEYDPTEIADVISPILQSRADVVYGSRFMVKKTARVLYFSHYLANKALTFFSNCLTNLNMSDIETCYKAFRGDIIRNLIIKADGFGFEVEVTAKIAKLGCSVYEVPISYYGRTYAEGKKIGVWDGVAAVWYILRFNLFVSASRSFREVPKKLGRADGQLQIKND